MTQAIEHLNPETLNAFIDDELPTSEQEGVQQHLAGCHQCTLRVLSATQLKAATARAGHRFAPPADALARLTAQLRREPQKTARIYSIRPIAWTALAAALVLAISLIGWRQVHQSNTLSAELLDQHLATLSSAATPQVISTDRHTVKPWFQGRLPFSFNLPDSGALPPDATLKGADLAYLSGQPATLLLFTIHKHQVSVFVIQRTGISDNPAFSRMANNRAGFSIHSYTTHDLRIIAVSDVNPADLDLLASAVVQAQSPR
jgi:anti-sigma factor RsiW